jgi:two-component sensor histidine kinase
MQRLCENVIRIGLTGFLTCDALSVMIPADDAITLGLLADELITNAVKYTSS